MRQQTYVINEVRASVCSVSVFSAASRYDAILFVGRRTDVSGFNQSHARAGSNSDRKDGEEERELGGVEDSGASVLRSIA